MTLNILFIRKAMLPLAWKSQEAYDAKTGEQSVFGEIHTIHAFEMP